MEKSINKVHIESHLLTLWLNDIAFISVTSTGQEIPLRLPCHRNQIAHH